MRGIVEDRLAAALEARAELVAPEDLRPIEIPPRGRLPVGVLLLAAAATAAVIAAPFLVEDGSRTAPSYGPAGSPSVGTSQSSESEPTDPPESHSLPADLLEVARQRADVDGDGRPDQVRVLVDAPTPNEPGGGFVEVSLAAGGTGVAEAPFGYLGPVEPALDVNGDGRDQVLVGHTPGGDSSRLLVFTWHEDDLVLTTTEGKAPLGSEESGNYVAGYYTQDRGLFSWSTRDLVGPTHTIEEWSWSVDGDRLVPTPVGMSCVRNIGPNEPTRPC